MNQKPALSHLQPADRVCVVLCRPEESRNIGSVCRAMKNSGLRILRIVGSRDDYNEEQVRTLALHAADIWNEAVFYTPDIDGLRCALSDTTVSAGTTRRVGQKRKSWGMTPEQFAGFVAERSDGLTAAVFGNERTGLTDEELEVCSIAVNIPSDESFPSLNLSHAVQVVSYCLFRALEGRDRGYQPVSMERLEQGICAIAGNLQQIGMYRQGGLDAHNTLMKSILSRAALSETELRHLESLFNRIAWKKTGQETDLSD